MKLRGRGFYWRVLLALTSTILVARAHPASPQTQASDFNLSIEGEKLAPKQATGGPEPWAGAWELWGDGYVETSVDLPASGVFTFTLRAFVKPRGPRGALSEMR